MRRTLVSLVCLLALAGCDNPAVDRPANTGVLRGWIYGSNGQTQPLGHVTVSAAGQTTTSAQPDAAGNPDVDNGVAHLTVLHDFGDGKGRVLADRVLLKYATTDGTKYVYLHQGEYLFEALPAGAVHVTASVTGDQAAAASMDATVKVGDTVSDVNIQLPVAAK